MKIRTKATGTDKKGARRSTLNPLVFTKGALLYGVTSVCALCEAKQPGHLNVWGVLRHFVPNKGLHPLRRESGYPCRLGQQKRFCKPFPLTKFLYHESDRQ